MENVWHERPTIHGSLHGPGYFGDNSLSAHYSLSGGTEFNSGYHLFGIEWEPESILWYVDGSQYGRVMKDQFTIQKPWVFDHPFYLIVNLAIGEACQLTGESDPEKAAARLAKFCPLVVVKRRVVEDSASSQATLEGALTI